MPFSLSRAFVESQSWPARVNEYHDGTSQRSPILKKPRRSWQLAKHIPAATMDTLRAFWQRQGAGAFYFYNPKETDPPFSYDPTGAAGAGRYVVWFANTWSEQHAVGPLNDTAIQLVELLGSTFRLLEDMGLLLDTSGSLTADDVNAEKAAAYQLIDAASPLDAGGGMAVYQFGYLNHRECPASFSPDKVSYDVSALKAAIAPLGPFDGTYLYACICQAAGDGLKTEVVMTDGVDTNLIGPTLDGAIAACVAAGVKVYTIGFGSATDPTVLARIANETGGTYYASATAAALDQIMAELIAEY